LQRIIKEKWFWLLIICLALIVVLPFLIIYLILFLPPLWGPALATVILIILWGIASGYKDYIVAKRREEEEKRQGS
jgi:uncharacterized protein involved in cysteine biosynthesis